MKKALLINPWFYDFKGYDEWMKPLGLLRIASILKNEGWAISFIDCLKRDQKTNNIYGCGKYPYIEIDKPEIYKGIKRRYKKYGISESNFYEELQSISKPDIILIGSTMTYWYPGVFETIKIAKTHFKEVPIILGGIYATLCYDHALNNSSADYIFKGTDINDFLTLTQNITGKKAICSYEDFKNHPSPSYNLLNPTKSIAVVTSLGCPFRCTYCASSILYSKISNTDPITLAEIISKEIENMNITDMAFYDDALMLNYENNCAKFISKIRSRFPEMRFHTPNALHAKYIDKKTAEHMKLNGFETIRLGFEFADSNLQTKSGGKVSTKDINTATENLLSAGFNNRDIALYIMCGAPECGVETIEKAIETCKDLKVRSQLVEYSPIPSTKMWHSFPQTDTILAKDPLFHNNTYHIYKETVIPLEEYNRLKRLSNKYNSQILDS